MTRCWLMFVGVALLMGSCPFAQPAFAQRAPLQRLAASVEPRGEATPHKLAHYIRCFRDAQVHDDRIMAFQAQANVAADGAIALTGHIEFSEMRDSLLAYLRHLGFRNIHDKTELLPSAQLGEKRFGFVTSTHALVRTQPSESAETATDALLGEPLYLLRVDGNGFLLCHTAEGYLGYIHSRDVLRVDAAAFHSYQAGKQLRMAKTASLTDGLVIPIGARLKWVAQTDASLSLELPDGDRHDVPRNAATLVEDSRQARVEQALAIAETFLGTRYMWGGKTTLGVDCSGLVQTSYAATGIYLPRDSNQQVFAGRLAATRWYRKDLRRGDTLYFLGSPGRITHTGIYLGDDQYIEAVRPTVRISSLNPGDDNYSRRGDVSFAFAKRLLD